MQVDNDSVGNWIDDDDVVMRPLPDGHDKNLQCRQLLRLINDTYK